MDTTLLTGDCADCMRAINDGTIACVYLDPPFNTGRTQRSTRGAYDDAWPTWNHYARFLRERFDVMRPLLTTEATILVHVDWRSSHRVRVMLDDLFGEDAFVNHLIWQYGLGGSSPRRFARKHDDILFYANGPSYYFDPPMVPARSQRLRGQLKKATDVLDIPALNNMARERAGYPTQKPLELLALLIRACCPPGATVLDPFCGSGTTLIAARRLGRRSIGIDRNPAAIALASERLRADRQVAATCS